MPIAEEIQDVQEAGLICPRCEAANLPQRKFCAKCGAPLWEPCFQCSEVCAAGENFCGACGVNLAEAAAEQLERVGDAFRAAAEMRSAARFDEAISLLAPIAENSHPRLSERAQRANQLIRQIAAERERGRAAAGEALQRARQCFDAFDYDGAAQVLEQVPSAMRGSEIEELYRLIAARQEEIASLDGRLREAVGQRRLLDLPALLERLLSIKPDHPYAGPLAEQVRKQLVDAAERQLAAHRYDEALGLLEQIAPHLRSPQSQELYQRAAELVWLSGDLRYSPVVDATLAAVARRLRDMAPDDARAAKFCDEVDRRLKLGQAAGRTAPVAWAAAPAETPLGVPAECLGGFRRMIFAESLSNESGKRGQSPFVRSTLRAVPANGDCPLFPAELLRSPGRFAVACGLALAGLKRAAVRINLLAAQQSGLLGRAARFIEPPNPRTAWGLDLGLSGLKAVKLGWDESKQQARIEAAALVEHAKPLSHAVNEAEEHKLVAETIKTFLASHETKADRVCIGLPGRMALARQFDLPPVEAAKAPRLVEFEARQQFPFALDRLDWGYQFFDDPMPEPAGAAKSSGDLWRRALLVGAQRNVARRFLDAFRRSGIRVDVLQTDFVALHNFLAYEYLVPQNGQPVPPCRVAAAVDVGCDATNIVVSSPQSLWFHSCGVAGQSFTRAVVRELKLTVAQAEQLKRRPESAPRMSDLYGAMGPVFDDLLQETQHALAAYAAAQPDLPIERVIGIGGGFSLHGLLRCFRSGR
jgi:type IV pilus assembly protein PilM